MPIALISDPISKCLSDADSVFWGSSTAGAANPSRA